MVVSLSVVSVTYRVDAVELVSTEEDDPRRWINDTVCSYLNAVLNGNDETYNIISQPFQRFRKVEHVICINLENA